MNGDDNTTDKTEDEVKEGEEGAGGDGEEGGEDDDGKSKPKIGFRNIFTF